MGTGIPDVIPGPFGASMLPGGNPTWLASGELSFVTIGGMSGPKGETSSWYFSHEYSVGCFGGFNGFQGTVVVFRADLRSSENSCPVAFSYCENEIEDPLVGPSRVWGEFDWEATIVVPF